MNDDDIYKRCVDVQQLIQAFCSNGWLIREFEYKRSINSMAVSCQNESKLFKGQVFVSKLIGLFLQLVYNWYDLLIIIKV